MNSNSALCYKVGVNGSLSEHEEFRCGPFGNGSGPPSCDAFCAKGKFYPSFILSSEPRVALL